MITINHCDNSFYSRNKCECIMAALVRFKKVCQYMSMEIPEGSIRFDPTNFDQRELYLVADDVYLIYIRKRILIPGGTHPV